MYTKGHVTTQSPMWKKMKCMTQAVLVITIKVKCAQWLEGCWAAMFSALLPMNCNNYSVMKEKKRYAKWNNFQSLELLISQDLYFILTHSNYHWDTQWAPACNCSQSSPTPWNYHVVRSMCSGTGVIQSSPFVFNLDVEQPALLFLMSLRPLRGPRALQQRENEWPCHRHTLNLIS